MGGPGVEPPAGSTAAPLVEGQGAKPPEAESFLAVGHPTNQQNLHVLVLRTVQCIQAYDRHSVNNDNPKLKLFKMVVCCSHACAV